MALNLASPGIQVREVDLTIGRVDATSGSIGALVAPFTKGPVEEAQLIESEEDLLQTFGQPYSVDKHYEYWMVASSYLAYGGTLQVIRAGDTGLKNAYAGTAASAPIIKSGTHYNQLGYDDNAITGITVAGKTPGSYANGITVSIIDAKADQVLTGISTNQVTTFTLQNAAVGNIGVSTNKITGINTAGLSLNQATNTVEGVVGIGLTITAINASEVILSGNSTNTVSQTGVVFNFGTTNTTGIAVSVGNGFKIDVPSNTVVVSNVSTGATSILDGTFRGLITEIGAGEIGVKINAHVSAAGTITNVDYTQNGTYALPETGTITIQDGSVVRGTAAYSAEKDWFEQQNIVLSTKDINGNFNTIE